MLVLSNQVTNPQRTGLPSQVPERSLPQGHLHPLSQGPCHSSISQKQVLGGTWEGRMGAETRILGAFSHLSFEDNPYLEMFAILS